MQSKLVSPRLGASVVKIAVRHAVARRHIAAKANRSDKDEPKRVSHPFTLLTAKVRPDRNMLALPISAFIPSYPCSSAKKT
jgi:hypothetical protein